MLPDVGFSELLVIALIVLLVAKPEDIPVIMRKLGVFTAHMQNFMRGMLAGWQENAGENQAIQPIEIIKKQHKSKPKNLAKGKH